MADRFRSLAERIVLRSELKAPSKKRAQTQKRILDLIESEERRKGMQEFIAAWNRYRLKYLDMAPIEPRTKSDLTKVENSMAFIAEHGWNMEITLACVHRAYRDSNFRPSWDVILRRGEELYEREYDGVLADFDRDDYEAASEGRHG